MYCKKCGVLNEDDALFCKKCGTSLVLEYEDDDYQNLEKNKSKNQKVKPSKAKTKTKVKNKVKKVKQKSNRQNNKRGNNNVVVERKMGLFSKIVMFLLVLLVIALMVVCGGLGYKIYSDANIEVPNVVSMSYDEAYNTLREHELNVEKVDKKVTDSTQVGVVLDQNKKANKKVSKNTIIKVYVGVLDDTEVVMINVVGMNIDKAKNSLNHKNISYKISYQDVSEGENDVVLKQSISSNTKVKKGQVVSLVVSKLNKSTNDTIDTDKKSDDLNREDDNSDSNDIENNE